MIYRFYAGLDKVHKSGRRPIREHLLDQRALELFGGYTKFEGVGGWRDQLPGGKDYVEPCLVYEIATDDPEQAEKFAEFFKKTLDQVSILMIKIPAEIELI